MKLKPENKPREIWQNMYVLQNVRQAHINVAAIANVVMSVNVLQKVLAPLPVG